MMSVAVTFAVDESEEVVAERELSVRQCKCAKRANGQPDGVSVDAGGVGQLQREIGETGYGETASGRILTDDNGWLLVQLSDLKESGFAGWREWELLRWTVGIGGKAGRSRPHLEVGGLLHLVAQAGTARPNEAECFWCERVFVREDGGADVGLG